MKLLFVAENMNINGANRSLLNLLWTIDSNEHQVDLFLFAHSGPLMSSIPNTVRLLPQNEILKYFSADLKTTLKESPVKVRFVRLLAMLSRKLFLKGHVKVKEKIFRWVNSIDDEYDLAVGYCEGSTHRFVLEKTKARKKVGWIHIRLEDFLDDQYRQLLLCRELDHVVVVSQDSRLSVARCGVEEEKITVIHNTLPIEQIRTLAGEQLPATESTRSAKLLTVGRLVQQKGLDLLLDTAVILKDQGVDFEWSVVGGGTNLSHYREKTKALGLETYVIFRGNVDNPYPFFANCDVYVQPSFSEGWGMAITEAKILGKPVVASNIPVFCEQISHEVNGLLCSLTAKSFAESVSRMITDHSLRESIVQHILTEDLGYEKDVDKLYELCR